MRRLTALVLSVLLLGTTPLWAAMQSIPGGFWIGTLHMQMPGNFSATTTTVAGVLDAATDLQGIVGRAPVTCSVDQVWVRTGAVTTAAAVDVRLESVDTATGTNSGSLIAANTSGQIASPAANTVYAVALTAAWSATRGNLFAIVAKPNTTPINLEIMQVNTNSNATLHPYGLSNTTGATSLLSDDYMRSAIRCSTGTWYSVGELTGPYDTVTSATYNTGTATTEAGLYFQLPVPCTLDAVMLQVDLDGDADVILYDGAASPAVIATLGSVDKDVRSNAANRPFLLVAGATQSLSRSTNYRIVLKPTSVTSVVLFSFTVSAAAHLDAFPGGQNFHWTEKTSGTWSQTTTTHPWIGIRCSQFQDGVGGIKAIIGG